MKTIINGININYEVSGEGEPLICLHGWNEDHSVFKARSYKNLLRGYRIYALDLPGFGESMRFERYSFEALNRILDQFALTNGLDRFCLLGQCMGGIIALDYAIRHSEKVTKLILVETMIYFPAWLNLLLIDGLNAMILKFMLKRKLGISLLGFHRALRNSNRDKKLLGMLKKADIKESLEYIKLMKCYSKYDHVQRAKKLKIPVTIITTGNTFAQVNKTASDLINVLENVQFFRVPGKSHFIYVEGLK